MSETKSREQERLTGEKIQSVKEHEWAKLSELQESRINLETHVTELEALVSGRETEFSLQLEQGQDRILSLETELAGSLRNREQLDDQLKEVGGVYNRTYLIPFLTKSMSAFQMEQQVAELLKELSNQKTTVKKFSQLKNQFQSLAASEQEYKQTNEQLNSRLPLFYT